MQTHTLEPIIHHSQLSHINSPSFHQHPPAQPAMPVHPISTTALDAIANTHGPAKPIFMLNLWKFKPSATYPPGFTHPGPCSGKEATERYQSAIYTVLPPNASIQFAGDVQGFVAAPRDSEGGPVEAEKWDWVAVVRYENFEGFRTMVESEKYKREVEPHRVAGLEEWRLIAMDGVGGVGVEVTSEE